MSFKTELVSDLRLRQQRLLELRDMTQDRDERIRLDSELDTLQLTLADVETMDEATLRRQRAARRATGSGWRPGATLDPRLLGTLLGVGLIAAAGAAYWQKSRRASRPRSR
jgi:hypothetical protein